MKTVKETSGELNKRNKNDELYKNYVLALKNESFKTLVTKLKLKEEVAMKYTSKLEDTVCELKNCKKCKSLNECKNRMFGCVSYPNKENDRLRFDYVACKYNINKMKEDKLKAVIFEEPLEIVNASMSEIDPTDKNRMHVIKWVKKFYTEYQKDPHIKGCYLHGSFGSGKSYILAALLNELAKKGVKTTIIYYPKMLRLLKESFNDDFDIKMQLLEKSDVLLIDDIGAESVSSWNRDEILGTILQYRMDSKLPTFFTSNLTLEDLEIHLSNTKGSVDIVKAKRILERIKQLTEDLELISENRRK